MIPSARSTVVAIIIFKQPWFCDILKSGDGRTDVPTETCEKTIITTARDYGMAEWIKMYSLPS